jgi:protein O-GlcNAc transferase
MVTHKENQKDPSKKEINLILELFNSSKFEETEKKINAEIINYPNSSILYNILGAVLFSQNKFDQSIKYYKKSIKNEPKYAQAYNNLGIVLQKQNKISEAINYYKKAITLKSDFFEASNNLGNALSELGKLNEALKHFEKAIKIKSDYAEAYNNLGFLYQKLGNFKKAQDNYEEAISNKLNYAEVYNNLGLLFNDLGKFEEAEINYTKAIKADPNYVKSYNNLGNLLSDLGKFNEADLILHKAIEIKPNYPKAFSNLLFNLNYQVDLDVNLYLSIAKKFRTNCKPTKSNIKYNYTKNPTKLKLGLVSADFGNHPGGFFTLSTLKELKKKNFELIAYSASDRNDEFSNYFKPLFSKWHSIEKKNDEEVVKEIIKDGIHILIDLQGHSAKNRLPIFMYKPAPVQLSWLAQGTTGINEIDYFVGSKHITPKHEEKFYVEKIYRLPEISQCFTTPTFDIKINELPALKNNFITFGCINKLSKINDEVIFLWAEILLSIPKSQLLIKNRNLHNKSIADSIIKKFESKNITKKRIIFIGESETRKESLETYNKIDITLDPFPYQGNTTTCESVWMGVPVLTLKGDRYLSHFGESINSNLNMNDWIAKSKEEYISKAIKFSSNIKELTRIRTNLRHKALSSPVFNAPKFAVHFNDMILKIWKNFNS